MILVNLNMASERLSQARTIGLFFSSFSKARLIANTTEKTTICNTFPSKMAFIKFDGKISTMCSSHVKGFVCGSASSTSGLSIPTPAWEILMARRPIANAIVVMISKYKIDFQPSLPTCFKLEWPAMPTTSVENNKGATITFTRLRNICRRKIRY